MRKGLDIVATKPTVEPTELALMVITGVIAIPSPLVGEPLLGVRVIGIHEAPDSAHVKSLAPGFVPDDVFSPSSSDKGTTP